MAFEKKIAFSTIEVIPGIFEKQLKRVTQICSNKNLNQYLQKLCRCEHYTI